MKVNVSKVLVASSGLTSLRFTKLKYCHLAEYAKVERLLGNGRLVAYCFDDVRRLCHIRGKLRKKVWINSGDIILVSLRDYQDQKADVILRYLNEEARQLRACGEFLFVKFYLAEQAYF